MPNTIKPTTVPQVTEGPLAVVPEVDDILALADGDVTIDPLTTGLPAGMFYHTSHHLVSR